MNIKIKDISKTIKGNEVLKNINLEMNGGNIYGLKGINGSGKTMLMRVICGLIIPSTGRVEIDGKILGKDISFPESVGALIENPAFLPDYTSFQNLKYLASLQGGVSAEEINETISSVGLDPYDKRKYKKYSLGMKGKLGIAGAILGTPKLIILDEPTNALDEETIEMVGKIVLSLKEKGSLVIISNHDTTRLETISDKIYEIKNGKIVHNPVAPNK